MFVWTSLTRVVIFPDECALLEELEEVFNHRYFATVGRVEILHFSLLEPTIFMDKCRTIQILLEILVI